MVVALSKSTEWAAKAKELELEASKDLLDLRYFTDDSTRGLRFIFSASKKGTESHVEMEMHDFSTSRVLVIRLEMEQIPKFIEVLQKVPATFEEYRKQLEKAKQLN